VRPERVDHTAIVVRDLDEAIPRWQRLTGGKLAVRKVVESQAVEIAMLAIGDSQLELISPQSSDSGVARYLEKHGEALHHVGLRVADIDEAIEALISEGFAMIDPRPRQGAHGRIVFLKPRSTGGVLVELIQHVDAVPGLENDPQAADSAP